MTEQRELTPYEKEKLDEYYENGKRWVLSTEPTDREAAKRWVCEVYREQGYEPPKHFVFARGVYEGALWAGCIRHTGPEPDSADHLVIEPTPEKFKEYVKQHGSSVYSQALNALQEASHGPNDLYYLLYYDFAIKVLKIKSKADPGPSIEMAKVAGWYFCFDSVVVICDRPTVINRDDQNELHGENGPAVAFNDGFNVYYWHGVELPERVYTDPGFLTAKTALGWENAEQRRALIEKLGWEAVLKELDAKVIDEDPDPQIGTLLEASVPDGNGGEDMERFLRVKCGTGRTFAVPVPPETKTARDGQRIIGHGREPNLAFRT